jgi:hypothetical protein
MRVGAGVGGVCSCSFWVNEGSVGGERAREREREWGLSLLDGD